jgi:hypothetical protein
MKKTSAALAFLVALAIAPSALAAGPPHQAAGNGKTHDGATFGFTAHQDLHAELEYINGDLNIHCSGLNRYVDFTSPDGYKDAGFSSTSCFDRDGNQYRVWVDARDRGEGVNAPVDKLTVRVRVFGTDVNFINDQGNIQGGNIQVLL